MLIDDPPPERVETGVSREPSRLWYLMAAVAVIGGALAWSGSGSPEQAAPSTTLQPTNSPTTSIPPEPTDPSADEIVPLAGRFPDGTDYVLHRRGAHTESVTTVLATIGTYPAGSGEPTPRSVVTLTRSGDGATENDWSLGVTSIGGEGDMIGIESGELLARLNLTVIDGFPQLEPRPPLALLPGRSEIRYDTFSVFDQCQYIEGEACSDTGSVSVSMERLGDATAIVSQTPRRSTDPYYFDPGPLEPRRSHRVWWSGNELLVFGGAELAEPESFQPGSVLPDGAAFDPVAGSWRALSPEEIALANEGADGTDAAWASPASAVGGDGFAPEGAPGRVHPRYTVWTGSEFLAWGVPCCGGPDDPTGGFDTWRWSGA